MTEKQKNQVNNQWDLLAKRFDTNMSSDQVHPDCAVNIHVGWSILMHQIETQMKLLGKEKGRIFDFGCGAGEFCKALNKQGHKMFGLDRSKAMLELAKSHLPKDITLINGDHTSEVFSNKDFMNKFDTVTSIHSLEWIEDINMALKNLTKLLKKNGLLLFAVFPKAHIVDSIKIKDLFEDFDSITNPSKGFANFDGIRVPVYIRDASYFDAQLADLNFEKVLEYYPPYPKYFLKSYNWSGSLYPEMMVLAYRKK
jgi:2-polyprenyl-3-methyl-5-hydroxy-6-metoxy-1,4-benzoquinol methylase